jgi:hypothetical protein
MVHDDDTYYSRETVRARVRFSVSPISSPPSLIVSVFFLFIPPPFMFRFSVFAYGHLQGIPAGPVHPDPHFLTIPSSHTVACPTRVRKIAGNEADAAQYTSLTRCQPGALVGPAPPQLAINVATLPFEYHDRLIPVVKSASHQSSSFILALF